MILGLGSTTAVSGQESSIRVASRTVVAGTSDAAPVFIESIRPVAAAAFGLCFDASSLDGATIEPCPGHSYDFFSVIPSPEGVGVAFIFDFMLDVTLPALVEHEVVLLAFDVPPAAPSLIPVVICPLLQAVPPLAIEISDDTATISSGTDLIDGLISVVTNVPGPPFPFLRGDVDGSGTVNISDAIRGLEWAFLGTPVPACPASLDIDGDDQIEALPELILLLEYLFLGSSPPAAPFPACGDPALLDCPAPTPACP